jgi:hypothetical protein
VTVTPHQVGQLAKAEILIADRLEAWGLTDPNQRAAFLLAQLQTELGWTPPKDLTETPPLRPDRVATDAERQAAMAQIRGVFNRTRDTPSTP